MVESDRGVYADAQPADHTRVCWSGALGYARRGMGQYNGADKNIADALQFLAEQPAACICPKRKGARRGRR